MIASQCAWRAWAAVVAAAGLSAVIAGCSYEPAPPKPSSSNTTGTAPPAATPGANAPPPSSANAVASPAAPTVTPASPVAAARPATYPVQLSAGVALPQTTVEGTKMGFSVDYQRAGSGASPMAAFWVIQRARGNAARISVRLQAGGNLATFLGWPSGEGPYSCRIEDSAGVPLSADAPMQ